MSIVDYVKNVFKNLTVREVTIAEEAPVKIEESLPVKLDNTKPKKGKVKVSEGNGPKATIVLPENNKPKKVKKSKK